MRHKFGDLFRKRRCLIPADGFCAWVTEGKKKVPQRFSLASGGPFGFAGLWDVWQGSSETLLTYRALTSDANELGAPGHDRMPVIIPPEHYGTQLDPRIPVRELKALLKPHSTGAMRMTRASLLFSSLKYDGPECLDVARAGEM